MSVRIDDVQEEEVAACRDGLDWCRRFVARNPSAHVLDVLRVYGHAQLTARLGPLEIHAVERIQAEMGAAGLFWNTPREEIRPTLEGLLALGAAEAAAVVERAFVLAEKKYPGGMRASGKRVRDPAFDPLDKEYCAALPHRTPNSFQALLAAYVRAHIDDI